jgi:hypothetical protein
MRKDSGLIPSFVRLTKNRHVLTGKRLLYVPIRSGDESRPKMAAHLANITVGVWNTVGCKKYQRAILHFPFARQQNAVVFKVLDQWLNICDALYLDVVGYRERLTLSGNGLMNDRKPQRVS